MGRIRDLFRLRIGSKEACQNFWSGRPTALVRLPQAVHTTIIAPTGVGKGVSYVVPLLLSSDKPCVVVDIKSGENAKLTAAHRRREFGHQIVLLDPYRQVTQNPDCFNPVDFIDKASATAIDDCNDLVNALVVRTREEKDPHWADSAERYCAAITATVVGYGDRKNGSRSLQTVNEILSSQPRLDVAQKLMVESDLWGGLLSQMGGQLMHFVDKEKSSVLSSTLRHLRFLATPAIAENTAASTFDPGQFRKSKITVYLILSPDRARAQSGLLRMWIASMMRACVRGGLES